MESLRKGVVLDTNILISATLWDNSVAQKLLFSLIGKGIVVYCSIPILIEYQNVLERDFGYTKKEIDKILDMLFVFLEIIVPEVKLEIVKDDPDDDKIIECAVEANVKFIITYDKHLLRLKNYQRIKIVKPEDIE